MAVLSLNSLPLGFRFRPTDVELIDFYLRMKINGNHEQVKVIRELDVCKWEPWDLPDLSIIKSKDPEWFFFCPLDRKYPNGHRLNRATGVGYWKATGKDRKIKSGTNLIGMKKTLVFYTGRAPKGQRTNWILHEYRATTEDLDGTKPGQSAFVLSRLFNRKDGSIDGLNFDEAEATVSSPTTAQSSPEVSQSELALTQVSPAAMTLPNNSTPVDQTAHVTTFEGIPLADWFHDSPPEPFSPLNWDVQVQPELSSCTYHATNDLSNSHGSMDEPDVYASEFADSLLNSCGEFGNQKLLAIQCEGMKNMSFDKDAGTCSGSDARVAQTVHLEQEFQGFAQPEGSVDRDFSVRMETAPEGDRTTTFNSNVHESLVFLQNESYKHQRFASISATDQFRNFEEISNYTNQMDGGEIVGTGIRIRVRNPQNPPFDREFRTQGDASRRVLMQSSMHNPLQSGRRSTEEVKKKETTVGGHITDENQKASPSEASGSTKFPEEFIPNGETYIGLRNNFSILRNIPSMLSRDSAAHYSTWSIAMFRIVVLVLLFVILVSTWRYLIFVSG